MEREVGGGLGMGKTCKPKAVSFQCMTKFTTKKKKATKKKRKERLAYRILLLLLVDPMMLPALQITTPHW